MGDLSNLIKAIASLLWPLLALYFLWLFKSQIGDAIGRLKKGKLLGQEVELNDALETLQQSASQFSDEVAALPNPKEPKSANDSENERGDTENENIIRSVIHEAARSPKAALLILAAEIEKEARQTLASIGKLEGRTHIPISQAIQALDSHYGLPRHMSSSLKLFWDTRNKIIHGRETEEGNVLSAIDSGVTILRSLQALPREVNIVYKPGVPIYSDPECQVKITDATGIILETRSVSGARTSYRIFPTTRTHFEVGKRVAWEWDMDNTWRDAWYRDSLDSGAIKPAWNSSAEFIGRHLDDL